MQQRLAQRGRFVEQDRAVRLDALPIAAAEQTAHRLVADLAHQIPQGDVDAADGVFDGAAAALPEGRLPQFLADAHRLVGPLADQMRPQQLNRAVDETLARHGAADADQTFVGEDFDDGVEIFFGLDAAGPAAVDGAA